MRNVSWLAICWALLPSLLDASEAPSPPAAWTMPATQRQAISAVVDQAVAAGLPDAKGGTLFIGQLKILRTDPSAATGKDAPRNGNASKDRPYSGLHLKLADGSWVVNLHWSTVGAKDFTVVEEGLKEVAADQLLERATAEVKAKGGDPRRDNDDSQMKKLFAADQLPMLHAALDMAAIAMLVRDRGDMAVPTAYLIRLGVPHAENLTVHAAGFMMWGDDVREFWEGLASPLHLLPGANDELMAKQSERFEKATGLRLPDTAWSLRHMLALYFLNQLSTHLPEPFPSLPPAKAAEAALAMLDPADPATPAVKSEIANLKARADLPRSADAGSSLAARLASWGGSDETNSGTIDGGQLDEDSLRQYAQMEDEQIAQMPAWMQRAIAEYRKGPLFTEKDLGGLVALAGDQHPCRWLDHGRYRTVGDNALRAIATLLGCDPRALLKRDASVRWNDAERAATAQALAVWWKDNQGKPFSDIIAGVIDQVPLSDLVRLLKRSDDTQRAKMLTVIASSWSAKPPADPELQNLARILVAAKDHAGLTAVVSSWPIAGQQDLLLATWHLLHGDGKPYDALLTKELDRKPASGSPEDSKTSPREFYEAAQRPGQLLSVACRFPTVERLNRLLAHYSGPAVAPEVLPWVAAMPMVLWSTGDEVSILLGKDQEMRNFSDDNGKDDPVLKASAAIPLAIFGTLLKDQRPAPKDLVEQYGGMSRKVRPKPGTPGDKQQEPKPIAEDLRTCDVAAAMFSQARWNLHLDRLVGENAMQRLHKIAIDFTDDADARNAVIADLRRLVAEALPSALKAAGLPALLPGITDVSAGGDDKAAF